MRDSFIDDQDATGWMAREAARLIVESGMEYEFAKRKAAKTLGRRGTTRAPWPSHEAIEDEVRDYLDLFCAQTQPEELRVLRQMAQQWMARLQAFRPHVGGAVWRGTATRLSAVILDLYCDDSKSVELELLNQGVRYDVDSWPGAKAGASLDVLTLSVPCAAWQQTVPLHLVVHDFDDLKGALKPDSRGRSWRGDLARLNEVLKGDSP